MLVFVLLLAAGAGAGAGGDEGPQMSCDAGSSAPLSLAAQREPGRYRVRYCPREPALPADDWRWDLTLKVVELPQEKCSYELFGTRVIGVTHSESIWQFNKSILLGLNCSHVCLSQDVDLLFRSCYNVFNRLTIGHNYKKPHNDFYFVDSELTRDHLLSYNANNTYSFKQFDHDNIVSIQWETKIPLLNYEIILFVNKTDEVVVTERCARSSPHLVSCELRPPPALAGCHQIKLTHRAPWTAGGLIHSDIVHGEAEFCYDPPSLATVDSGSWVVGAAAAGAGLLCACAAAGACWVRRARRRRERKQRVQHVWLDRAATATAAERVLPAAARKDGPVGVLLLHARDCAALSRFARVLAALLRDHLHVQVWDVYSPEVVAATGAAPAAWVLRALQDPAVPVVLLQTPALQLLAPPAPPRLLLAPSPTVEHFVTPLSYCLLADLCNHTWVPECGRDYFVKTLRPRYFRDECDMLEYNCDHLRVEAPLLGAACAGAGRVMHRAPHCADALLPLAARALAAAPAAAPAYRKYYIATVSALEVEALRTVVPYRRYVLPAAAPALLRDLRPAAAAPADGAAPEVPDDALRELREAHHDLLQFVRNNPDFLAQEMMVV